MRESKLIQGRAYETNFSFQDKQQQQPTHFFQTFSSDKTQVSNSNKRPPEVDLNLRLSLGEIYNGNTKEKKSLTRSSSIAGEVTLKKNCSDQFEKSLPKSFLSLARSCSLPAEVERSNKKVVNVKELRIMRRVEAKKRAEKKQRNAKKCSDQEKLSVMEGPPSSPTKIPAWAAASAAKSPALIRAIDKIKEGFKKLEGREGLGTLKGASASATDSKSSSKPIKAESMIISETTSNEKSFDETKSENPTKKAKFSNGCNANIEEYYAGMNVMKKMPSVTTTGDGPNGRRIQGFLYKYMKGQVSIVCVCHGSFLSPEEFVKHAGGKGVTNPMKHINVCSTSFFY